MTISAIAEICCMWDACMCECARVCASPNTISPKKQNKKKSKQKPNIRRWTIKSHFNFKSHLISIKQQDNLQPNKESKQKPVSHCTESLLETEYNSITTIYDTIKNNIDRWESVRGW